MGKQVAMDGKRKREQSQCLSGKEKEKERKKERRTKRRKKKLRKAQKIQEPKVLKSEKSKRCKRGKTRIWFFPLGGNTQEYVTTRPMDYITGICRMRERLRENQQTKNEERITKSATQLRLYE